MNSFFSNLKQRTNFHQTDSDPEEDVLDADCTNGVAAFPRSCSQNRDIEVDDFLFVETEEQDTVNSSSFSCHKYPDSPPTYKQVESDGLPSYHSVVNGLCTIISGPSGFSEVCSHPKSKEDCLLHTKYSSVSGVPFQLHPALQAQQRVNEILSSFETPSVDFDWFKYSYDFQKERHWLEDFISAEMTNINELIAPLSISQSCDKEDMLSETDETQL